MSLRKIFVALACGLMAAAAHADSVFQWGPWVALPSEPTAAGGLPSLGNIAGTTTSGVDTNSANNGKPVRALPERELRRLIELAVNTGPLDAGPPVQHPGDWVGYAATGWQEGSVLMPKCPDCPGPMKVSGLISGGESMEATYRLRPLEGSARVVFFRTDGTTIVLDKNARFYDENGGYVPFRVDNGGEGDGLVTLMYKSRGGKEGSGDVFSTRFSFFGSNGGVVHAGVATPLPDMTALKVGQVTGNYAGSSFNGQHAVSISVNFGASTWAGQWSGGKTFVNLKGGSDFSASGTVQGANIAGAVSGQGIDSGSVKGTFVGQQAAALIGATQLNVQKTTGGTIQVNDVFAASKEQNMKSFKEAP